MAASSAVTRRMRSRRTARVFDCSGPTSKNVPLSPSTISTEIVASWAANRCRASPKSVLASITPAQIIPVQISLARVTAKIKTSLFAPGYTLASVVANEFNETTGTMYPSTLFEIGLVLLGVTVVVEGNAQDHIRTTDASLLAPIDAKGQDRKSVV